MKSFHPRYSTARPIQIPPSQDFEGIDGPWSSFTLRIGNPSQDVKVFVSTASHQTLVVAPQGCSTSDPANCAQSRGGIFHSNESTTWNPHAAPPNGTNTFAIDLERNLGYSVNGEYGSDTVGHGWQGSGGPSLDHQLMAGIADEHFYFGSFGLSPRPSNLSDFDDPIPSYLSNLKTLDLIPSLSWAYTAGNQYRLNKVLGSLTLGGYDTSLFIANNLSIAFNEQDVRDLTVNINKISSTCDRCNDSNVLLSDGISAFIDSTIPYLYLPLPVCERFESAFGIEWSESVQGYLVNDTLHENLRNQNPSVTFTISNSSLASAPSVNISLPYAAFDLIAEFPLVKNTSRYFPLMRAANDSQYTLGRTFLQEAYIIADYERRNFSVSQCSWNQNAPHNLIAIQSPENQAASGNEHHLSLATVAGTVIGSVAVVFALGLAVWVLYIRRRHVKQPRLKFGETSDDGAGTSGEMTTTGDPIEVDGLSFPGYEIDGKAGHGPELGDSAVAGQELEAALGREVEASHAWPAENGDKDVAPSELPA